MQPQLRRTRNLGVLVIGQEQGRGLAFTNSHLVPIYSVSQSENEAILMEELAIAINLNIAASCLKLSEKQLIKTFWMLFDPYNEELKREFNNIENLCHQSRENEPSQDAEVCKIEFDPLSLTKSDANFVIDNPGASTGSHMESTPDIVGKQHENQIESQMDLYKSNPTVSHNQFEPLDMMLDGRSEHM
ncbi:hypothetical protein Cgig2_010937 [Carnegiea gigantea]|uniref:Uncharacterized protein n=1 Tax=Carnegiea gigantea TaxID=171969 RepID=A0A9Q1JKB4_9CARY|nr:hypothetical protein Cgig2_010937 [Carnegiea gigantea]